MTSIDFWAAAFEGTPVDAPRETGFRHGAGMRWEVKGTHEGKHIRGFIEAATEQEAHAIAERKIVVESVAVAEESQVDSGWVASVFLPYDSPNRRRTALQEAAPESVQPATAVNSGSNPGLNFKIPESRIQLSQNRPPPPPPRRYLLPRFEFGSPKWADAQAVSRLVFVAFLGGAVLVAGAVLREPAAIVPAVLILLAGVGWFFVSRLYE